MTAVSPRSNRSAVEIPGAVTVTPRTDAPADPAVAVTHGRVGGGHGRPLWKQVAIPTEHGGWGLSAEPGLLGLLVKPSWAGAAIALAAIVAFLVRTPLKLAVIDRRRGRNLERTRLATRIAAGELVLLAALAFAALLLAGPAWLLVVAVAAPLVAVELWFDVRSRGRRLVPELAGSVGICCVAAAVAIAGGASTALAVSLWLILAARAVATVAFARTQVLRFRRGSVPTTSSDWSQVAGTTVAVTAEALAPEVLAGTLFIAAVAVGQVVMVRRPPIPPKVLGFTQLGIGLGLVAVTAASVALL